MATGRELLLLDANVVIDYAIADLGVLGLVAHHIGLVYIVRSVLDEVEQIRERDCKRLGIAIVEPSLEQLVAAGGAAEPNRLSFTDGLSLVVAHDAGWTCVTNDAASRTPGRAGGAPGCLLRRTQRSHADECFRDRMSCPPIRTLVSPGTSSDAMSLPGCGVISIRVEGEVRP